MAILTNLRKRISGSDNERGAILILSALIMMLLLFIAAFATDLGAWYRQGQAQQRAADVGSLNGMQAYDREYKAYFDTAGVQTWTQLTAAQRIEAERQAMAAAVNTIIGLLETSGHTFSSTPTEVQLSPPPNVPGDQSIFTITSDDGTVVTITREADGMSVSLSADGDQYFSNLLRDAPQITRKSTAVLSNCGAECTHTIEINPPFVGFAATGQGDGYGPLLFDKDTTSDGIEEIWAVNHHSNSGTNYNVICMNVETKSECSGSSNVHYPLNYDTGNRPTEYIAPNGKIYFSARDRGTNRSGLACFDAATRAYCSTAFVDLFDATQSNWSGWINVNGPWEYNGELFIVSQDGQLGCVTAAMAPCAIPTQNLATFGDSRTAGLHDTNNWVTNGEQLGSKLYLTQNTATGVFFHCVDLSNRSSCFTPVFNNTLGNGGDDNLTFFRYDTAGNETGVCVYNVISRNSGCVSLTGSNLGAISGMSSAFTSLTAAWGGDAISWEGKRTFLAGGNSNRVGCWSWEDGGVACPDGATLTTDSAYTGAGTGARPYGFAQISDSCIIGLGHDSIFFSFNPEGFTPCVDAKLSTVILPCTCADGTNKWGEVRLPSELMAKVDQMWATISATEGGAAVSTDLDRVELHNNGGVIDLRTVDQSLNVLYLTLEVNAKLDPTTGDPVWTEPISADLAIIVQPTLAN
ncbi:MAG: hypothetical protein R8J94_04360 [Acidimicrobiia bacterium]|nr:hypothetical protein [Acidimicrobiia bacterium]